MPVRYKTAALTDWVAAETRDIGVGGAFIATAHAEPIGTTLTVEVRLPTSEQLFTLPAVVRWAALASAGGDGSGMGVQFVGVDVDVLLELNDYFATLTG